jgi:ankyrin repeat protein
MILRMRAVRIGKISQTTIRYAVCYGEIGLPLHLAIVKENWNVAELIWDHTKQTFQTSYSKSWEPGTDNQGLTTFHYAAISESAEMMKEPLTKYGNEGYDVSTLINQPDLAGWTPLHWACRRPRREAIQTLSTWEQTPRPGPKVAGRPATLP